MNERDEFGRFTPGSRGGPGRPKRSTELNYVRTFAEGLPLEKWKQIVEKAAEDALNGDDRARAWLSSWLLRYAPSLLEVAIHEAAGSDDVSQSQIDFYQKHEKLKPKGWG